MNFRGGLLTNQIKIGVDLRRNFTRILKKKIEKLIKNLNKKNYILHDIITNKKTTGFDFFELVFDGRTVKKYHRWKKLSNDKISI